MTLDGTWRLEADTPVGPAVSTLEVRVRDGRLEGTQTVLGAAVPIRDGRVTGDRLAWTIDLTQPFPMTLLLLATVAGDRLSGTGRGERTGSMPFTGVRTEGEVG